MKKLKFIEELVKMGDPVEQVMAEPDEGDLVDENVDGLHPTTLNQQNPWPITQAFNLVTTLIASSGWYAVGFVVLACVIWIKVEPKVTNWKRKRDKDKESAAIHKDPDKFLARERAIDEARQRMQEQYNHNAVLWAEKQKEEEEKQRQDRAADLERHEREGGYISRSRVNATTSTTVPAATATTSSTSQEKKNSGKAKLKPEYNPMTGDVGGGSCRWRPDKRGASGGG